METRASVHLVQSDIAWEDKPASRARIERMLESVEISPGDLIALPEMCETGFSMNTDRTIDHDGSSARWLSSLARDRGAWVLGGITSAGAGEKARNRALVFDPDGAERARYDKVHPFSFGKEAGFFEGGDRVRCFDWGASSEALRVSVLVCYDLRFPELFRAGRAMGAEAFVVIANWPAERSEHWAALLQARAIENQAFVVGVNRAGDDPYLAYAGGSVVRGPKGEILGQMGAQPGVLSCEIDPQSVRSWRGAFRAWEDAKPGLLPHLGPEGVISGENRQG